MSHGAFRKQPQSMGIMPRSPHLRPAAVLLCCTLSMLLFSTAGAQDSQSPPTAFVQRPLTLPQGVLRAGAAISVVSFGEADIGSAMAAAGALGVTDDVEVGLMPLGLAMSPEAEFTLVGLYGQFRLLDGPVQLAMRLGYARQVLLEEHSLTFSLPIQIGAGPVRLDSGLHVSWLSADSLVGLANPFSLPVYNNHFAGVPLVASLQFHPNLFAGVRTGVGFGDLDQPGDSLFVPLGAHLGSSVRVGDALLDVASVFRFPVFVGSYLDNPVTDFWQLNLEAQVHFQVFTRS